MLMGITKEPKTGRKGGSIGKVKRENIKNEIITLIQKGKFSEINNNKLSYARDKKITRVTLNKLLEEIIPDLNNVSSEIIKVDIMALYERMKSRILYWWDKCESVNEEEQSFHLEKQVFREMREVLKDFRQTCIDLGVIEKVSEKIDLTADITQRNINVNIMTYNNERINEVVNMEVEDYDRLKNNS